MIQLPWSQFEKYDLVLKINRSSDNYSQNFIFASKSMIFIYPVFYNPVIVSRTFHESVLMDMHCIASDLEFDFESKPFNKCIPQSLYEFHGTTGC